MLVSEIHATALRHSHLAEMRTMIGTTLTVRTFATLLLAMLGCLQPARSSVTRDDNAELLRPCRVSAYLWQDDTAPPKAAVVLVHGFTQQGKSVEVLATRLAQERFLVVSLDQRGHGRWHYQAVGDAFQPEGMVHKPESATGKPVRTARKQEGNRLRVGEQVDYRASVEDLKRLVKTLKQAHPELSLYCIGESAGGGIVAEAARAPDSGIDGVVLCSPGSRPRIYNVFWVITDFFRNVYRLNHPVDLRRYIRTYASHDPRVVEEMIAEPLDRNELSGRELLRTVMFIHHIKADLKHMPDHVPLLVLQGRRDRIVQPRTVPGIVRGARTRDKSLVILPDYGHVLIGTSFVTPTVSGTISAWLDARLQHGALSASRKMSPDVK